MITPVQRIARTNASRRDKGDRAERRKRRRFVAFCEQLGVINIGDCRAEGKPEAQDWRPRAAGLRAVNRDVVGVVQCLES